MNAARPLPLVDLFAVNDNALDDSAVLSSNPRARAALASPLRSSDEVPAPGCRRWHTVGGVRALSSILVVESHGGRPRWRASVTIWGRPNRERREVARLLAIQLLAGVGVGRTVTELGVSTTIMRRDLAPRERAALTGAALAIAFPR